MLLIQCRIVFRQIFKKLLVLNQKDLIRKFHTGYYSSKTCDVSQKRKAGEHRYRKVSRFLIKACVRYFLSNF